MKRDKGAGHLSRMYCLDRVPDTQRPCIRVVILQRGPGRTLVLRGLLCASSSQSSEREESVCEGGSEVCSFSQEKAHGVEGWESNWATSGQLGEAHQFLLSADPCQ